MNTVTKEQAIALAESGFWKTMPVVWEGSIEWHEQESYPITCWVGRYDNVGKTSDWEDSLETRPENI